MLGCPEKDKKQVAKSEEGRFFCVDLASLSFGLVLKQVSHLSVRSGPTPSSSDTWPACQLAEKVQNKEVIFFYVDDRAD